MTELHTNRLTLRDWKASDEQDLIRIAGQAHIERWLPDWREYDKHAKGWIEWAQKLYQNESPIDPFTSWAITLSENGKLIGQILMGKFDEFGETETGLGYFMDKSYCSQGYMTEAVQAVTRHAFDTYGYDHIAATIQPENISSRRVAEKAGFRYIKAFDMKDNGQTEALPFCYYRLEREEERIICIREHSEWMDRAVDYFAEKWGIDRNFYRESMSQSLASQTLTPNWYLLIRGESILGCCGIIDNDFMVEPTFTPWLCGLYVEASERGKEYGSRLLGHVRVEAARHGVEKVYLNTDHVGYYERYDWRYLGSFPHNCGESARVYEADQIRAPEEMASFFDTRAQTYDEHMLVDLDLAEFYGAIAACFANLNPGSILDLGCGTGLQLERLFSRFPNLSVTGIDLSSEMLAELQKKYPKQKIEAIRASYFDVEMGEKRFDHALSTYSLHHFSEEEKEKLYKKIYHAIKPGGVFVLGDYTVATLEQQRRLLRENERLRRENGISGGFYHFDTPFTAETERKLLLRAGFIEAETVRAWDNTSIIVAKRAL